MPKSPACRRQRVDYTDKKIQKSFSAALESLRRGEHGKSVTKALRAHNLPSTVYRTLRNRYLNISKAPREAHSNQMFLRPEQELALVDWMKFLVYIGVPVCRITATPIIMEMAGREPSQNWLGRFMKRHPDLESQIEGALGQKRVPYLDYPAAKEYYKKLKKVMLEKKVTWDKGIPVDIDVHLVQGFVTTNASEVANSSSTSTDTSNGDCNMVTLDMPEENQEEDPQSEGSRDESDVEEEDDNSDSDEESESEQSRSLDQTDHMPNNGSAHFRSESASISATNTSSSSSLVEAPCVPDPIDDLLEPVILKTPKRFLLQRITELQVALRIMRDSKIEAVNQADRLARECEALRVKAIQSEMTQEMTQEDVEVGASAGPDAGVESSQQSDTPTTATGNTSEMREIDSGPGNVQNSTGRIFTGPLSMRQSRNDLRDIAEALSLGAGGTKKDLLERIQDYFISNPGDKALPAFADLFKPSGRLKVTETWARNNESIPPKAPSSSLTGPSQTSLLPRHHPTPFYPPYPYVSYDVNHLQIHPQFLAESSRYYNPVYPPPSVMYPNRYG
ncbi:hypothetical protein BDQ17DRAFT_1348396 [Cyathus striatus]|nr:hypothetical protein BDQ17DRAFT_1348396 [Cyathus striatus]